MKELIAHLLKCNMEQILARSLVHCHCENLHSIMLLECPGKTVRLFVAEPGHKLWCNAPEEIDRQQSIAIHPHHCDITLVWANGTIWNWIFEKGACKSSQTFAEFEYNSAITSGKIGFRKVGPAELYSFQFLPVLPGRPQHMAAKEIHTVIVPKGETAAWFALEGKEDPNYRSRCFSKTDLENASFEHLYKPMSETEVYRLLNLARLI